MGRASIDRDGAAIVYRMPRNPMLVAASLAAILVCAGLSAFVLRGEGGAMSLWTWLFPALVAAGLLPTILNAAAPQQLRVDDDAIEVVRWYGRRRIAWADAIEAVSYTNGQDLFLRVRTESRRILLSTRWSGWDASEMRIVAGQIDAILDGYENIRRPGPLDRFPSLFTKEAGLGGTR
jgi:hypothetical protein